MSARRRCETRPGRWEAYGCGVRSAAGVRAQEALALAPGERKLRSAVGPEGSDLPVDGPPLLGLDV
eukprot:11171782-Alexandrium_andersonii.AAC.1